LNSWEDVRESRLLQSIQDWNIRFPFDYQWRRKYNVPFGCTKHRNMDLFDIKFDIEEERMIQKIMMERAIENKKPKDVEVQLLKREVHKAMSKEDMDEAFDDLDLSQFDDMKV